MNIQQMHIEVDLASQKISSNAKRKFRPEEIDWLLNKNIGRFVASKLKKEDQEKQDGFQSDEYDLDALRTLMVTDHRLPVYKLSTSELFVSAELPGNYAHLLEASSLNVRSCDTGWDLASAFTVQNEWVYKLTVKKSTKVEAPYYLAPVLSVNGTPVMTASAFPPSLEDKNMNFVLQDLLRNELLSEIRAFNVYWERYKNLYTPETLFFVSSTQLSGITLTIDGIVLAATEILTPSLKPGPTPAVVRNTAPIRVVRSGSLNKFRQSTFAKTQWKSAVGLLQSQTLKVYHDNTFIVNNLSVDYIRKPRLVNLSLSYGCDLPDEYHQQICDLTVEYIKQAIGDPNYQWKLQDNQIRQT
jgi:hypothetical protein